MHQGKQQDEHIAKLLREAAELREQLGDARDRVEAKVEESLKFAAKAAEAHAARADMTRKLADAQEAMRGNQTVSCAVHASALCAIMAS